jgi:hypothetical protein
MTLVFFVMSDAYAFCWSGCPLWREANTLCWYGCPLAAKRMHYVLVWIAQAVGFGMCATRGGEAYAYALYIYIYIYIYIYVCWSGLHKQSDSECVRHVPCVCLIATPVFFFLWCAVAELDVCVLLMPQTTNFLPQAVWHFFSFFGVKPVKRSGVGVCTGIGKYEKA